MIKKMGAISVVFVSFLLCLSLVSASLSINLKPVSNVAIPEINKPAIYNLELTNNGFADNFTVYSIAGFDLYPNQSYSIESGQTVTIPMTVYPKAPQKASPEYITFEYKVAGVNTPLQTANAEIILYNLNDAISLSFGKVSPEASTAVLTVTNKYGGNIDNLILESSSPLFTQSFQFSLTSLEEKRLTINLNEEKIKMILSGPYVVDSRLSVDGFSTNYNSPVVLNEKEGLKRTESKEGMFDQRFEVEVKNEGNRLTEAIVVVSKSFVPSLFTSFNIAPNQKEQVGLTTNYIFKKELSPNESLRVVTRTNWWFLVGLIVLAGFVYYLIVKYVKTKVVVRKTVSFVRTKGGEFALKVNVKVKARDFVEKIRIFDRLPPMVKVFEKYGVDTPNNIDERNRRLEWNIQALGEGEERVFSYIIYSKIGVMGRFELPAAEAIYEYNGKIKESSSNKAYFMNESFNRKD